MMALPELLLSGLARTTACTTLAALTSLLLLPALGIGSPRIHRLAWVLVILQGWILIPLTFTLTVPTAAQTGTRTDSTIIDSKAFETTLSPPLLRTAEPSGWGQYSKQTATAAWLLGMLAVLGFYLKRYYWLYTHIPVGSAPESGEWHDEWCEATQASSSKANVHLRITNQVGPLLCFVPFVYLVLVPKRLWESLNRSERVAILRHELAHLWQGDLWKNLVVRILMLPQWFNPLVWLAVRRFEEAGEWACDAEVLRTTHVGSTDYANTLLRVAGFSVTDVPCGTVAVAGGMLTRRVTWLLSSSDMEVSRMKNLALPLLLLGLAVGQAVRIESVLAEESVKPVVVETEAEVVAKWHEGPYRIEPPDVLSVEVIWNHFDTVFENREEKQRFATSGVALFEATNEELRLKAKQVRLKHKHLVGPDGKINLQLLEPLYVAGMTVKEVEKKIAWALSPLYGVPDVKVEVIQSNSKVFYAILKQPDGDNVRRLPCTKESKVQRVLYALGSEVDINGIVYLLSPARFSDQTVERLEIDLQALLFNTDLSTNYSLLPGDRLYIESEKSEQETDDPALVELPLEVQVGSYAVASEAAGANQDGKVIKCNLQIVEDFENNLAEIDGIKAGGAIITDSGPTQVLIRVLEKNKLAHAIFQPTIKTKLGKSAFAGAELRDSRTPETLRLKGISVNVLPSARDEGVMLATEISLKKNGGTIKQYTEPILQEGQTCVLRLFDVNDKKKDLPPLYFVLSREFVH